MTHSAMQYAEDILPAQVEPAHYTVSMMEMDLQDLDPFEFRLLAEYRRQLNLKRGSPISIRELAKLCKMNARTITSARLTLEAKGRIAVEARGRSAVVTVLDVTLENAYRVAPVAAKMQHEAAVRRAAFLQQPGHAAEMQHASRVPARELEDPNTGIQDTGIQDTGIPLLGELCSPRSMADCHDWPAEPFDGWINLPAAQEAPEYGEPYMPAAIPLKAPTTAPKRAAKGLFRCKCGIEYHGSKTGARGAGWLIEDQRVLCAVCRAELPKEETITQRFVRVFAETYYAAKDKKAFGAVRWSVLQILHGDKRTGRCDGLLAYEGDGWTPEEMAQDVARFKRTYGPGITPPRDCAKFMTAWHAWRTRVPRSKVEDVIVLPTPTEAEPPAPREAFERQLAALRAKAQEGR